MPINQDPNRPDKPAPRPVKPPSVTNPVYRNTGGYNAYGAPQPGGRGAPQYQQPLSWLWRDKPAFNPKQGYTPSFWEDPKHIAQYHLALQAAPPGWETPAWLDKTAIANAYTYFKLKNGDKPWYQWDIPDADDPIRQTLQGWPVWDPLSMPGTGVYRDVYATNTKSVAAATPQPEFTGTIQYGNASGQTTETDMQQFLAQYRQLSADQQTQLAAQYGTTPEEILNSTGIAYTPAEGEDEDLVNGIPKSQWDALPGWQKAVIPLMSAQGQIIGGVSGAMLLGGIAPGVGHVVGGLAGLAGGTLLQKELMPDETGQVKNPGLMKIMMAWDAGAEAVERILGTGGQILASLYDPKKYGPVQEILSNLDAAWKAAGVFEESGLGFQGSTVEYWNLGETEQRKWSTPGGENASFYAMRQMRNEIAAGGVSPDEIKTKYINMFGWEGQARDLIGHMFLDPLNYLGKPSAKGISLAAKLKGNMKLAEAMANAANPTQGFRVYASGLRVLGSKLTQAEIQQVGSLGMLMAGFRKIPGTSDWNIDTFVMPRTTGVGKVIDTFIGLTPQARANEVLHTSIDGLRQHLYSNAWEDVLDANGAVRLDADGLPIRQVNPDKFMAIINQVANVDPAKAVAILEELDIPKWFNSYEGQGISGAAATIRDAVAKIYEQYKIYEPNYKSLERISTILGEDPHELLARLHRSTDDEANTIITQLKNKLQQAADAGDRNAGDMLKSLNSDEGLRTLTGKTIKSWADNWLGDNDVPYAPNVFGGVALKAIEESLDKYVTGYFNVKPAGYWNLTAQVLKHAQTYALLGWNPNFLLNNFFNNFITMGWDGLLGFNSHKVMLRNMKRMGIEIPVRFRAGNTAVEMADQAAGLYDVGKEIRRATRGSGWLQMVDDWMRGGNKALIAARGSQAVERMSSEIAMHKGIMEFITKRWRVGDGIRQMDGETRRLLQLAATTQGLPADAIVKRVESAINQGRNLDEIKRIIFDKQQHKSLNDVLQPDQITSLQTLAPDLYTALEQAINDATTDEQVRRAFNDFDTQMIERIKEKQIAHFEERMHDAMARTVLETELPEEAVPVAPVERPPAAPQAEPVPPVTPPAEPVPPAAPIITPGLMDVLDDIDQEWGDFWLQHFDRIQEAKARMGELSPEAQDSFWYNLMRQENELFNTHETSMAASWQGIFNAVGGTDEGVWILARRSELHDSWRAFFDLRERLWEEYRNRREGRRRLAATGEAESRAIRQENNADFQAMDARLNEEYLKAALFEDQLSQQIDTRFEVNYGRNVDTDAWANAVVWRGRIWAARRRMVAAEVVYRMGMYPDTLRNAWGDVLEPELIQRIQAVRMGDDPSGHFHQEIYTQLLRETFGRNQVGETVPPAQPAPIPPTPGRGGITGAAEPAAREAIPEPPAAPAPVEPPARPPEPIPGTQPELLMPEGVRPEVGAAPEVPVAAVKPKPVVDPLAEIAFLKDRTTTTPAMLERAQKRNMAVTTAQSVPSIHNPAISVADEIDDLVRQGYKYYKGSSPTWPTLTKTMPDGYDNSVSFNRHVERNYIDTVMNRGEHAQNYVPETKTVIAPQPKPVPGVAGLVRKIANEYGVATIYNGKPNDVHALNILKLYYGGLDVDKLIDLDRKGYALTEDMIRAAFEARKAAHGAEPKARTVALDAQIAADRARVQAQAEAINANMLRLEEVASSRFRREAIHREIMDALPEDQARDVITVSDIMADAWAKEEPGRTRDDYYSGVAIGAAAGEGLAQSGAWPKPWELKPKFPGEGQVFYHGTTRAFDQFDPSMWGSTTDLGVYGAGFYFSRKPTEASIFAMKDVDLWYDDWADASLGVRMPKNFQVPEGAQVIPARLRMDNPVEILDSVPLKKEIVDALTPKEKAALHGNLSTENLVNALQDLAKKQGNAQGAGMRLTELWRIGGYDSVIAGTERIVFDHAQITNAFTGRLMQPGEMLESPRGYTRFLDDGRAVIQIMEHGDVSTVLHELLHYRLSVARRSDIDMLAGWVKDEYGLDLPDGWQRGPQQHAFAEINGVQVGEKELIARAWEKFLSEGVAPTPGLAGVFERMKQWLVEIYHGITGSGIDVKMNEDVRRVFRQWLGGDGNAPKPEPVPYRVVAPAAGAAVTAPVDMTPEAAGVKTLMDDIQWRFGDMSTAAAWATSKDFEDYIRSMTGWDLQDEARLNLAYDTLEGAFNLALRDIRDQMEKNNTPLEDRLKTLDFWEQRLTKARRTVTKMEFQQFSTPLTISEAAGWAAGVRRGDVIMEPTAGTGNLVDRFALKAQAGEVNVLVNEIDAGRRAVLEALGYKTTDIDLMTNAWVVGGDGKLLPPAANVMIANPPWGAYSTGKYGKAVPLPDGSMPNDWSQRFTYLMLRRLEDGGRFVGIMPTNWLYTMDRATRAITYHTSAFFKWLDSNYAIRGIVESPPDAYKQRATNIGSLLVVVDKVKPDEKAAISAYGKLAPQNWKEYADYVKQLAYGGENGRKPTNAFERPAAAGEIGTVPTKPGAAGAAPTPVRGGTGRAGARAAEPIPERPTTGPAATGLVDPAALRGEPKADADNIGRVPEQPVEAPAGRAAVTGGTAGQPEPERQSDFYSLLSEGTNAVEPAREEGRAAPVLVEEKPQPVREPVQPGLRGGTEEQQRKLESSRQAVASSRSFTVYNGRSVLGPDVPSRPHPVAIVETKSLSGTPFPKLEEEYRPSPWVMDSVRSYALSDNGHLDAIWAAIQQNDKHHSGFLLADDVGVGKSRVGAGFVLDRIQKGKKRILVITKDKQNVANLRNEFAAVYAGKYDYTGNLIGDNPDVFPAMRIDLTGESLPQVKNGSDPIPTFNEPVVYFVTQTEFANFAKKIEDLRIDAIVVDEVHLFKNSSGNAQYWQPWVSLHKDLIQRNASILYMSATPGTDIAELRYLYGLRLWALDGFEDWLGIITGKESPEMVKQRQVEIEAVGTWADKLNEARKAVEVEEDVPLTANGYEYVVNQVAPNLYVQGTRVFTTEKGYDGRTYAVHLRQFKSESEAVVYAGMLKDRHADWTRIDRPEASDLDAFTYPEFRDQYAAPDVSQKVRDSIGIADPSDIAVRKEGGKTWMKSGISPFEATITPAHTEQIMREMKAGGYYMSRDISRAGVEFNVKGKPMTPEAKAKFNRRVALYRRIIQAYTKYGRMNKGPKAQAGMFGVGGDIQADAKRMLFDARLDDVLKEADEALDRGERAVISLISVSEVNDEKGSLPSAISKINTQKVDKIGEDVYSNPEEIPEAMIEIAEIREELQALGAAASPIDRIKQHFGDRVRFVTGQVTDQARQKAVKDFHAGRIDVLVISGAGKTGINLHDTTGKRVHLIVGDYEWSATNFKQELGRVDRTGQVTSPKVTVMHMGTAGERKFVATISARMKGLGATSKGAAESTGTALMTEEFEMDSSLSKYALEQAWSVMEREDKKLFLDKYFKNPEYPDLPRNRLDPTAQSTKKYLLALQQMEVDEGNRIFDIFLQEREKLAGSEAAAMDLAAVTSKGSGAVLRQTQLNDSLRLTEAKDADGHKFGIVDGILTPYMNEIKQAIAEYSYDQRWMRWVHFLDEEKGEYVSGLVVPPTKIKALGDRFGKMVGSAHTLETALDDIYAGDKLAVIGDNMREWTLYLGQAGERRDKIIIDGAKMSDREGLLNNGARYNAIGNFFFVPDDALPDFLHRFPIRNVGGETRLAQPGLETMLPGFEPKPELPPMPTRLNQEEAGLNAGILQQHAMEQRDTFLADVAAIAQEAGMQMDKTDFAVKGIPRMTQKMIRGKPILDALRASIIINKPDDAYDLIGKFEARGYRVWEDPYRVDAAGNRLPPAPDIVDLYKKPGNGYKHVAVKLVRGEGDPVVKEMIFITPELARAKNELGGHYLYDVTRAIDDVEDLLGQIGEKVPEDMQALRRDLLQVSDNLYSAALGRETFARVSSEPNLTSEANWLADNRVLLATSTKDILYSLRQAASASASSSSGDVGSAWRAFGDALSSLIEFTSKESIARAEPEYKVRIGNPTYALGPNPNERFELRYKLVDLDELVASHTDDMAENPAFPQELQPRDRERKAYLEWVTDNAAKLDSESLLLDTKQLDRGMPIVGADNVVESGNGRVLLLRRARMDHPEKFSEYQALLKNKMAEYGLDPAAVEGMKAPVLVRERIGAEDRIGFARKANENVTMGMSAVENAANDVRRIDDQALVNLEIGEDWTIDQALRSGKNAEFVDSFIEALPQNERSKMVDAKGNLSQEGLQRVKNAILMSVFPGAAGERLASAMIESANPQVKNLQNVVYATLPKLAKSEALVRQGARASGYSIAEDLAKAVEIYARLKKDRQSVRDYLRQLPMLDPELDPMQQSILAWINDNARTPTRIRRFLEAYADEVELQGATNQLTLFAEFTPLSKAELLDHIAKKINQESSFAEDAKMQIRSEQERVLAGQAAAAAPETPPVPVGTVGSMSPPPAQDAVLEGYQNTIRPMIRKAQDDLTGQKGYRRSMEGVRLDQDTDKQLRKYMGQVGADITDLKIAASRWGEARRDGALLNYNRRYGFDNILGMFMPYEFWYTRSMMKWAGRALNNPGIISNYMRLQDFARRQTEREGFPTRLKRKIGISLPFLPKWMGENIYIDPLRQLFPFDTLVAPARKLAEQKNMETKRAESKLNDMLADEQITQADYDAALKHTGTIWDRAVAAAKDELDQDIADPLDYAGMMVGFSLPFEWARQSLRGTPEKISQLPATRLVQAVTAGAGIGGPRGVNLESGIRNVLGLPEVDRYEDWRVDRMLANLVATGDITVDDANRAMVDRTGPAFELAQRRVSQMGFWQYVGAPLSVDFFPEGEQVQRQLQKEYSKARDAALAGDSTAWRAFFDKYPEYESRLMSFKEPEERLRSFLRSEVWDKYNALGSIQKRQVKEQLGDLFSEQFVNKETRSYDSIKTSTYAMWAQMLGSMLPEKAGDAPQLSLKLADDATAKAVDDYYAAKDSKFPNIDQAYEQAAQTGYYSPITEQYQTWKNQYLAKHPEIIGWVTGETSDMYGVKPEIQALVYQYRAQRDQQYPNIFAIQEQYFTIPEQAKQERKSFLAANPQLEEYWTWRKQVAASYPEAAVYILGEDSLANYIQPGTVTYDEPAATTSSIDPNELTPALARMVAAWLFGGQPLSSSTRAALRNIWEKQGSPGGDFGTWLNGLK